MDEFLSQQQQQQQAASDNFCQNVQDCYYSANAQYFAAQDHDELLYPARMLFTATEGESRGYADDATWILTASFVILTMQSGFGLLEAGSCSPGFEVNIMMKNLVDVVFGALAYYLVGYGISFGRPSTPFMGLGNFPADGGFDEVESGLLYSRYIFQLSFAATATTIVSGCVAMRLKFFVYCMYSFFSVIFYSFCAHWVFDTTGWLALRGVHDFAGGAPVHIFGGMNGLVAILFLGPRQGRFDGTRHISDFFPSSPTSQCFGLFMLWWGWIGFNCGSSFGITDDKWVVAIRCAVTTINATVGGGCVSIIYSLWRTNWCLVIPDHVVNGILGSLVAITPTCAAVHTYDAFPIGAVGALVGVGCNTIICGMELDDPVGGVGVHLGGGIWGMIAVGLFADSRLPGTDGLMDGLFRGGGMMLLWNQILAIIAVSLWAIAWASTFFYTVGVTCSRDWKNPRSGLRVDPEEEERGADWHLHGVMDHPAMAEKTVTTTFLLDDDDSSVSSNFSMDDAWVVNDNDAGSTSSHMSSKGKKHHRNRKPILTRKSDMYDRPSLTEWYHEKDQEATAETKDVSSNVSEERRFENCEEGISPATNAQNTNSERRPNGNSANHLTSHGLKVVRTDKKKHRKPTLHRKSDMYDRDSISGWDADTQEQHQDGTTKTKNTSPANISEQHRLENGKAGSIPVTSAHTTHSHRKPGSNFEKSDRSKVEKWREAGIEHSERSRGTRRVVRRVTYLVNTPHRSSTRGITGQSSQRDREMGRAPSRRGLLRQKESRELKIYR